MICPATACAVLAGMAKPSPSATRGRAANYQGVDADHFAGQVDQRSAGVALVDGRIGLDQVFDIVAIAGVDRAPGGADHTHSDRVLEIAQRRADGDHRLTRVQGFRVAQHRYRRGSPIRLEHRQVGVNIRAHQAGLLLGAVRQDDPQIGGAFHYVVIGQHIALLGDEHPAAAGLPRAGRTPKSHLPGHRTDDGDHCRPNLLHHLGNRGLHIGAVHKQAGCRFILRCGWQRSSSGLQNGGFVQFSGILPAVYQPGAAGRPGQRGTPGDKNDEKKVKDLFGRHINLRQGWKSILKILYIPVRMPIA